MWMRARDKKIGRMHAVRRAVPGGARERPNFTKNEKHGV